MDKYITETNKNYSLIDKNTGEIIEYKQVKKVSIDDFIMVFFNCFPEVFKLEGNALKVLMCMWKQSSYNKDLAESNVFTNNYLFKEYVRSTGLNLTDGAINLYVTLIAKTGLIIKKCRGTYMLNPTYFFKGNLANRSKLQLNIVVEPNK